MDKRTKPRLSPKLLYKYQRTAIKWILNHQGAGLFLDMGLGKTISTLSAIYLLKYDRLLVNKTLIVAPLRVTRMVWQQEADKWEHTKGLTFSKIIGSPRERQKALKVDADVYLINYENLGWLTALYGRGNWPFDMVVLDESSKVKNHASLRFKALKMVRPLMTRVVILTGTPRPNGLIDLWSQVYLLDEGERLGKNITTFRKNYFYEGKVYGSERVDYLTTKEAELEVYKSISDICISMDAKDYLELPPRRDIVIRVPMTPTIHEKYKEFEREKVLELLADTGDMAEISVNTAAALSIKLRQYANGAVYDAGKVTHEAHNLKIEALEEILEAANGEPVLCFYSFKHDLSRIQKYLKKYKPVHLKGDKDFDDWNAGKINLACGHLASMGHGLNLQDGGHIVVFFGPDWNLDLTMQGITRVYRQGVKRMVTIYKIVLEGSIDERIAESNTTKKNGQDGLLNYCKALKKKYLAN